ncbi:hypothetical protein BJ684DRAFT_16998 [Piptocephalis cylindrospora]|uniref:Uncharacterized protein n=1 Tax=Piptocephalis cylindrospora TaxID=1907219 RepID=A0A4V1IXW9_9FUNG|nr:hypothetical protein BJ684DRAFT_16998 [Piptocephalis cylindrospora]|eukprot:RKP12519.1 hypothetical protein BJ684DRAFT_16998 [Piptocephalis cylindrospora]
MKFVSILCVSVMLAMPLIVAAVPTPGDEEKAGVYSYYSGPPGRDSCDDDSKCLNYFDDDGTGFACAFPGAKKNGRGTCVISMWIASRYVISYCLRLLLGTLLYEKNRMSTFNEN